MIHEGSTKSGDAIARLFNNTQLVNKLIKINSKNSRELKYLNWGLKHRKNIRYAFRCTTKLKWPSQFTGTELSQYIKHHVLLALNDQENGRNRNYNGNQKGLIKNTKLFKRLRNPKKVVS
jgi:hypothetical protein